MSAKIRTMTAPESPRRLCRMLSHERLTRDRSCLRITEPTRPAEGASTSDTDTRIEHSIQDVGNDVAEDDHDRNQIEDRAGEHVVLSENRLEQVEGHPVIGEDSLEDDRPSDDEA